ncbi:MAG: phosphorylase [Rhodomicrobium sp.]
MKMLFDDAPVIVAAGMAFEARIATGIGVRAVYGQKREVYLQKLHDFARAGARGIISFGVAGGLSPLLKPGDVVVASSVVTARGSFPTNPRWSHSLQNTLTHAVSRPIFAADATVMTVLEKEALWKGTGAAAVDMESGAAAEVANYHKLPFAVLRVIIDPAHRSIPISAAVGARENGTTDALAVIRSLIQRPGDLGEIIRLADDARKANRSLFRCRNALGPFFSLLDPLDLPLNVE